MGLANGGETLGLVIGAMPDDFNPTMIIRQDSSGAERIAYYRERKLLCIDGKTRKLDLAIGYKMVERGAPDAEQDRHLCESLWQARELVRLCDAQTLSLPNLTPFEFS